MMLSRGHGDLEGGRNRSGILGRRDEPHKLPKSIRDPKNYHSNVFLKTLEASDDKTYSEEA